MANKSINRAVGKMTKGNKMLGIVLSVLIIALGIVFAVFFFNKPLRSLIVFEYAMAAAFIVMGVVRIIGYAKTPAEQKNAMLLVNSIFTIILGVLLLLQGPAAVAGTFAYLFGFVFTFNGITRIAASNAVKAAGGSAGWAIFSGIITILSSFFFFGYPLASSVTFAIISIVYLVVDGVILLIDCLSAKTK